jgi:Cu+-exporting ATPase
MVYEILKQSNACEYYDLESHPGKKAARSELGSKYAYLDNEEIKRDLMEFSENGIGRVKFFIPVIHCSACIWLLENLSRLNRGVMHSSVNFVKKEVTITFRENELSLRSLVELLVSVNYVPHISLDDLNQGERKKAQLGIYYRLGVAGFCFANIMMFSFPSYLSMDGAVEQFLRHNFGLLNILLAIPVAFYAGSGYLVSAYKGLRRKFISIDLPIAVGILALFFRSSYEILSGIGDGYMDSLSGLVFFLLIGKWYQGKTYEALSFERDYRSYFPVAVTVLSEEGEELILPLKKLKPGMRILVRNQELVPADALLVSGAGYIDYSFVSGESNPIPKQHGDRVYAGGRQVGSSIELLIEKEVTQSRLTELWNQDPGLDAKQSRWDPLIDALGKRFTIVILFISLIAGTYWWFVNPREAFNVITSILIVACPCALALTVPFSLGGAMRIFGRAGFYLKRTSVVESLAKVDTIVFDKTGTITQNDLFDIDFSHLAVTDEEMTLIRSTVRHSTHPSSVAVYRAVPHGAIAEVENFEEVPAQGIRGQLGAHKIAIGSASFTGAQKAKTGQPGGTVYVAIDSIVKGFILIKNRYRNGMDEVLKTFGKNYEIHLLSGDNESELPQLLHYFPSRDHIHFFQSPADKLNYVNSLKEKGRKVLMIGDGLNDAGALRESDCGISVADNVYHFSPACDAILESSKFASLVKFLTFSKRSLKIVYLSLVFSFLYNIVGLSFAVTGNLTPIVSAILMPLSSVTVVGFITIATYITSWRTGLRD